ncbi:hypothetical protein [Myxococcus sp. RHSTA-1-4]|uniref:hypothetical protein n=1 Tax=Myxococcus sp. RHSTA-1-4 TaxID=2874601 RepID=UPI001CBDC117|nr:hypothetical protein [Myxococcus sp. RHSTA-1-4]MBZ4423142.1 hypothetical protein [Myxococcus sp. RHSTA-1-4]
MMALTRRNQVVVTRGFLGALFLLLACQASAPEGGTQEETGGLVPATDTVRWTAHEAWPTQTQYRQVGEAFRGTVHQLEVDDEGRSWLIRQDFDSPEDLTGQWTLEVYAPDGQRVFTLAREEGVEPYRFVRHPSGELTLFELQRLPETTDFRLRLRRLSPEGQVLAERGFEDPGRPEEWPLYLLDATRVTQVLERPSREVRWGREHFVHLRALALGEEVAFIVWSHGLKLYRLAPGLDLAWDLQLMPDHSWMDVLANQEQLTLDAEGNLLVGWGMFRSEAAAWQQRFGRELAWRGGEADILVQRISPDGRFLSAQLHGNEQTEQLVGMGVHQGELLIGAVSRVLKHDRPNDTTEWDLVLMRARLEAGTLLQHRVIDVAREDLAYDFQVDAQGRVWFAGVSDFLQVDTNSLVEFGQGLLLRTDVQGERTESLLLKGPRHVTVRRLALHPDGTLRFAGTFDGPITHTGDEDPSLGFSHVMLGVGTWP